MSLLASGLLLGSAQFRIGGGERREVPRTSGDWTTLYCCVVWPSETTLEITCGTMEARGR